MSIGAELWTVYFANTIRKNSEDSTGGLNPLTAHWVRQSRRLINGAKIKSLNCYRSASSSAETKLLCIETELKSCTMYNNIIITTTIVRQNTVYVGQMQKLRIP